MIIDSLAGLDHKQLRESIASSFGKPLMGGFFERNIRSAIIERDYRGGAIMTDLAGMSYLSKFWVTREARGEGIARDIWQAAIINHPKIFWRSRENNSFNDWYMRVCHGMQTVEGWRVFWRGLETSEIAQAVTAASSVPEDFET